MICIECRLWKSTTDDKLTVDLRLRMRLTLAARLEKNRWCFRLSPLGWEWGRCRERRGRWRAVGWRRCWIKRCCCGWEGGAVREGGCSAPKSRCGIRLWLVTGSPSAVVLWHQVLKTKNMSIRLPVKKKGKGKGVRFNLLWPQCHAQPKAKGMR